MISYCIEHALILVAIISGIPLVLSTALSFGVSFLQAATQIQEQSISFLIKLITVAFVLGVGSHYFASLLIEHLRWSLENISHVGS